MNRILQLASISDVGLVAITSNLFWLILFSGVMILFRNEFRLLLRSLGRFKIAGAVFEIKEGTPTLEYYDIFAKILGEILAKRDAAEMFYEYISPSTARQLAQFILKYAKNAPEDEAEIEILKNVALLVGRKGNTVAAISLYDALLKQTPDDFDLLYLKGRILRDSGIKNNIVESERIYTKLTEKYKEHAGVWYGLARSRSLLGMLDESLEALSESVRLGYWWSAKNAADMLERRELAALHEFKSNEINQLRDKLATLQSDRLAKMESQRLAKIEAARKTT